MRRAARVHKAARITRRPPNWPTGGVAVGACPMPGYKTLPKPPRDHDPPGWPWPKASPARLTNKSARDEATHAELLKFDCNAKSDRNIVKSVRIIAPWYQQYYARRATCWQAAWLPQARLSQIARSYNRKDAGSATLRLRAGLPGLLFPADQRRRRKRQPFARQSGPSGNARIPVRQSGAVPGARVLAGPAALSAEAHRRQRRGQIRAHFVGRSAGYHRRRGCGRSRTSSGPKPSCPTATPAPWGC